MDGLDVVKSVDETVDQVPTSDAKASTDIAETRQEDYKKALQENLTTEKRSPKDEGIRESANLPPVGEKGSPIFHFC